MSKLSNELYMVKLLMNHKKYTINELSKEIEVSTRMIRTYKEDLEKAGIFIESIKGKSGDYILYDNTLLPNLKFSKYDIELVEQLKKGNKDKVLDEKIDSLLNKLKYEHLFIKRYEDTLPDDIDEKELLSLIINACKTRNKIRINYVSLNKVVKSRIIQPCSVFLHGDEDWVIAAFCELRGEVRLFNLNRIKEYEILKETF